MHNEATVTILEFHACGSWLTKTRLLDPHGQFRAQAELLSRFVRVVLVLPHGRQAVVDQSVVSLVRTNGQNHITHRRIRLVEHIIIIIEHLMC